MTTPINTVNRKSLVYVSPNVQKIVEAKLYRNFTAVPYNKEKFEQTANWLSSYCRELNNIANTTDFSHLNRNDNGNYVWVCDNNMGKLIMQISYVQNTCVVIVLDEDLTSYTKPYILVSHKHRDKNGLVVETKLRHVIKKIVRETIREFIR